ncbi:hypothetical protein CR513_08181, partial [Mucuna pruriens]
MKCPSNLYCFVKFSIYEGIDFMGPFPISYGNSYILLAIDYVSRWVEARATKTNDARTIVDFVKSNIFCRFGVYYKRWQIRSRLLEDALWTHRTVYLTPLGISPYRIVFGKACHLLVEIEHRAYWVIDKSYFIHLTRA